MLIDSLDNFNLKFVWYGVTSDWSYRRDALQLDVGVNANTTRAITPRIERPDLVTPLYFNTGHKQDASGFAKLAYTAGARDAVRRRCRRATPSFAIRPTSHAGITRAVDRMVVSQSQRRESPTLLSRPALAVRVVRRRTPVSRREATCSPASTISTRPTWRSSATSIASSRRPFTTSRLGATYRDTRSTLQANVYSMDFRNEIAPIGALSYTGSPLRQNVGASYRRGIEADATYRAIPRVVLTANLATSINRIRSYTDASQSTPVTYNDVEPLLTPRFTTFERAQLAATRHISLATRDAIHQPVVSSEQRRFPLRSTGRIQSRRHACRSTCATTRSCCVATT